MATGSNRSDVPKAHFRVAVSILVIITRLDPWGHARTAARICCCCKVFSYSASLPGPAKEGGGVSIRTVDVAPPVGDL